jgi:hypothetical protein
VTGDAGDARDLVGLYVDLGRRISARATSLDALSAVTAVATDAISGVSHASVTQNRNDTFETVAPTDPVARAADQLQYELNSGPCVDSIRADRPLIAVDLAGDDRWPQFGPLAARRFGVGGMLSTRLVLEADHGASLNLYFDEAHSLDGQSSLLSVLLCTHAAQAMNRVVVRQRAFELANALESTRRTAMAIGVVMGTHTLAKEQALDLLRIVSQNSNQRMAVLAEHVIATGTLELPGRAEL